MFWSVRTHTFTLGRDYSLIHSFVHSISHLVSQAGMHVFINEHVLKAVPAQSIAPIAVNPLLWVHRL